MTSLTEACLFLCSEGTKIRFFQIIVVNVSVTAFIIHVHNFTGKPGSPGSSYE